MRDPKFWCKAVCLLRYCSGDESGGALYKAGSIEPHIDAETCLEYAKTSKNDGKYRKIMKNHVLRGCVSGCVRCLGVCSTCCSVGRLALAVPRCDSACFGAFSRFRGALLFAQQVPGTKMIISRRPGHRFTRSKKFWKALSVLSVAALSLLAGSVNRGGLLNMEGVS